MVQELTTKPSSGRTLKEFFEQDYMPRKLIGKSASNVKQYHIQIMHFGRFLGHEPTLADLTDDIVTEFLARHADTHAAATVNKARSHLLALWRMAARKRLVESFPDVMKLQEPERTPRAWTVEQLKRLLEACGRRPGRVGRILAGPWWVALHRVFFNTGERTEATLSIEWSWVDLHTGWLIIPPEVRKGRVKEMTYKLKPETIEALRAIQLPRRRFVFERGGTTLSAFYYRYQRLLRSAGLPDDRRSKPQRMRRSFASHLEAAGGNATKEMRHSSRRVTEQSYLDPTIIGGSNASELLPKI